MPYQKFIATLSKERTQKRLNIEAFARPLFIVDRRHIRVNKSATEADNIALELRLRR